MKIVPDVSSAPLLLIMAHNIVPDSFVYTDDFQSYNVLDVLDFHHFQISHSKLFTDKQNHSNGVKNFWNQAMCHMHKFNGVLKAHFGLFLKEC